jgi:phosphomannomutase
MSEQLIISISGLRGIVGENLTASVAEQYGCAFGTYLKKTVSDKKKKLTVCMGRDSRASGRMLGLSVSTGLTATGIDVIDLGIVTTPGVGIMVRELQCDGGVIITASHNPIQYNGIKLLLDNGMAPTTDAAEQIKQLFLSRNFIIVTSSHFGKVTSNTETDDIHIAGVLAIVDKNRIAACKFKVVLDSVNGAGARVTKKLLSEFGCEFKVINDEPTGLFAHRPEPIAKNLTGLCKVVKAEKAQVGFAQDPDADRLAIVDENGGCIGEEYTLALAAKHIFSKRKGKAATNLSTSRMIDDVAEAAGCEVLRTAVGETNVAAAMLEKNCVIGGEGNGGVIDLRVGPIRDSLVAIALVLELMAETGKSIGELVEEVGGYYMSKDKFVASPSQAKRIMDAARKSFANAKLDTTDGCRFDFEDGWLHLRSSNTEPVMRLIVEARDESAARQYIDAVSNIRKEVSS